MIRTASRPLLRVALFVLGYLLVLLGTSVLKGMTPPRYADVVWGATSALILLALTAVVLRREGRAFADVGMRPDARTALRLVLALLAGIALYPLILFVIAATVGPLHWSAPTWPPASQWGLVVASFLALSCMEELGFRAYALRTLAPTTGGAVAVVVLALAFALTHLTFGWPLRTVLMGVLPSGLLFGACAMRRGGLALAIGVHAGLNIARWMVGEKETPGIWTLSADAAHTARLATGAPWVATLAMLLAAATVWWWPARYVDGLATTAPAVPRR